jgi:hypothetical protein
MEIILRPICNRTFVPAGRHNESIIIKYTSKCFKPELCTYGATRGPIDPLLLPTLCPEGAMPWICNAKNVWAKNLNVNNPNISSIEYTWDHCPVRAKGR